MLLSDVDIVTLRNPFEGDLLARDADVEGMTDGFDDPTAFGWDDVMDDPAMGWSRCVTTGWTTLTWGDRGAWQRMDASDDAVVWPSSETARTARRHQGRHHGHHACISRFCSIIAASLRRVGS